jgi:hypothetical protein
MSAQYEEGPIGDKPSGPLIVAEHMASVMRRMFKQAAMVAKEASSQVDSDEFGRNEWAKAMTKMFDIAMVGSIDMVQTAAVGPAPYSKKSFLSRKFQAKAAQTDRALTIAPPGVARPGSTVPIPADKIKVVPQKLAKGETDFYFEVNEDGLPSGVYTGKVRVGSDDDADKEIVDVAIRL